MTENVHPARLGLVTSRAFLNRVREDALLTAALEEAGVPVGWEIWDDPQANWRLYSDLLIRSCWDYHLQPDRFRAWIKNRSTTSRLFNPPRALLWNLDKEYLLELHRAGAPVVPTLLLESPQPADILQAARRQQWSEVILKPAVSASAYRTFHIRLHAPHSEEWKPFLNQRMLLQPFLPEVTRKGEWSLIFIGGRLSHAVLKRPAVGDFRVQHEFGGSADLETPNEELTRIAQQVIALAPQPLLYARVDLVETQSRGPLLLELELIEPALFLERSAPLVEQFVQTLLDSLKFPQNPT